MTEKFLILINFVVLVLAVLGGYKWFVSHKIQTLNGENWTAKKIGAQYVLSVKNHTELSSAIADFVKNQNIKSGNIIGIGAVNSATLRFFNPQTKQYEDKTFEGQMEITNLTGNIAQKEEETLIHLHITLGQNDYNVIGGHLLSAQMSGAGEFVVNTYPCVKIQKTPDSETGLNFYDFSK